MIEKGERPDFKRFPDGSNKTYGLMCVVPKRGPGDKHPDTRKQVQAWPSAIMRELGLFILCLGVLSITAVLFDAPLEELANPDHPPNPSKAPWYFLGLQEMVAYSAFWGGIGIPGLLVVLAMVAPYLERKKGGEGVWFHPSRAAANWIFLTVIGILLVLTVIGTLFRGENWDFILPW